MKQLLLIVTATLCLLHITTAQSINLKTLNTTGGYYTTGYYKLEWSLGEATVIDTYTQPGAILTCGVLQPLTDKPFGTGVDDSWAKEEIRIFPTPTRGAFEVSILTREQGVLNIQLVDALGQVIKRVDVYYYGYGRIERFDISKLASTNYFLRVTLSPNPGYNKKQGAFKILKVN